MYFGDTYPSPPPDTMDKGRPWPFQESDIFALMFLYNFRRNNFSYVLNSLVQPIFLNGMIMNDPLVPYKCVCQQSLEIFKRWDTMVLNTELLSLCLQAYILNI